MVKFSTHMREETRTLTAEEVTITTMMDDSEHVSHHRAKMMIGTHKMNQDIMFRPKGQAGPGPTKKMIQKSNDKIEKKSDDKDTKNKARNMTEKMSILSSKVKKTYQSNPSHLIMEKKSVAHLVKCQTQYPDEEVNQVKISKFESSRHVLKNEKQEHLDDKNKTECWLQKRL